MFNSLSGLSRNVASGIAMLAMVSSIPINMAAANSPASHPVTAPRPKLIVAISIDQFSSDLFAEWRGRFTGGLKRMTEGVVFPSGYQAHAASETCPGHSTLMSGIHPARSGIAANSWMGKRNPNDTDDGEIYCVEDESVPGSTYEDYTVSLKHLSPDFQTLGDRMKAQPGSTTRVFAVSGKDRGATLMAGRNADQTWWYDWRVGGFTTYNDRDPASGLRAIPALATVNARIAAWIKKPSAVPPLPAYCQSRISPVATRSSSGKGEPYIVGTGAEAPPRTDKPANTAKDFRVTRALDVATLDIAENMVVANHLGHGSATDVLAISLSGNDYFGHAYGTEGPEICGQLMSLDARLGAFFKKLDTLKIDYAVVLSADHGGYDAPERSDDRAYPAAERIKSSLDEKSLSAMVAAEFKFGDKPLVEGGPGGDYWFTPSVPADRRAEVAQWLKTKLLSPGGDPSGQVETVYTNDDVVAASMPSGNPALWSLLQRVRASWVPGRSGDFYIVPKHGVMAIAHPGRGYVATHGSPWDYDRRVPILFWWKGVKPYEQPNGVDTVDILPTLAALVGLPITPGSVDGRCLDLDQGPGSTCP